MQLYLDCPCTSFPRSFARDYKETYRYPPPSTVYGLLLSLVGEVDMAAHLGVRLAIGIIEIIRFGGLSLGESCALVNGIRAYRQDDGEIRWLKKDRRGLISLPVWINRESGQGTFQRFSLGELCEDCWVSINNLAPTRSLLARAPAWARDQETPTKKSSKKRSKSR